jgi:hypothetical protein
MSNINDLRWQKLLWSCVLLGGLVLIVYLLVIRSATMVGPLFYPYIIWPYLMAFTLVISALRFFAGRGSSDSFFYIFTGVANACVGLLGLYLNFTSAVSLTLTIRAMFAINLLVALFLFLDIFKKRSGN